MLGRASERRDRWVVGKKDERKREDDGNDRRG